MWYVYNLNFSGLSYIKIKICFSIWFVTTSRMPFDTKNLIGFLIGSTIQYIIIAYELHWIASVLSFAIGAFMFAIASSKEIKGALHDFNQAVNDQTTTNNRLYIFKQFNLFVFVYSNIKQLSRPFNTLSNFRFKIYLTFILYFLERLRSFQMYYNQYS